MEIIQNIANNPNSGGLAGAGAGLGMGMAAGSVIGEISKGIFSGMATVQESQSASAVPGNSSTPKTDSSAEDPFEKLAKLKKMLDAGLIEQEEYDAVKKNILANM